MRLGDAGEQGSRTLEIARVRHACLEGGATGLRFQLVGRSLGDLLSLIDDDDTVREVLGFFHVLGGEQHRRAGVDQFPDESPHLVTGSRVQAGGRLVEEQDRGVRDQAGPDVEAPPHPARVGLDQVVGRVREREPLERLLRAAPVLPRT
ncbi:MAG TPA: hypothetical protein VF482_07290 [Trebonia sp.]